MYSSVLDQVDTAVDWRKLGAGRDLGMATKLRHRKKPTESSRHAQDTGPTNSRDTSLSLPTGDGARAQRAFITSEGPRTTTGLRSGTGVASQA
jgi:hypothetical protein